MINDSHNDATSNTPGEKTAEQNEPLLNSANTAEESAKSKEDQMFDPKREPPTTCKIITLFLKLAVPSILTNLLGFATVVTSGVFAGRMNDPVMLAVVGMSNVCCSLMVMGFMIGLNAA